jgi:hypothetical protein
MVECLSETLNSFPGATNQMHCFVHTLSISAKAILKQFDVPKGQDDKVPDVAAQAFADLAKELEKEEISALETQEMEDEQEEDWALDSWVNFHEGLSKAEHKELDVSIQPVRSILIKVCVAAFVAVCYLTPNPTLTDRCIALQDGLCSKKLYNNPSPTVAQHTGCPPPSSSYDAMQCLYLVELNI